MNANRSLGRESSSLNEPGFFGTGSGRFYCGLDRCAVTRIPKFTEAAEPSFDAESFAFIREIRDQVFVSVLEIPTQPPHYSSPIQ